MITSDREPADGRIADHALGLRANLGQFLLLVLVNAFVGAMVGMERSILPSLATERYGLVAATAILSFIVAFGSAKAITNYATGVLADRLGRKRLLVVGWIVAAPVPFMLIWAPTWTWVLVANVLLGISQGLTWSTTVVMKIDLVGPRQRGLAMGLNEFAGYLAVGLSALATGVVAERYGLVPEPFYLGIGYVVIGLLLSALLVRDTKGHVALESREGFDLAQRPASVFRHTSFTDRNLSASVQAGFVNNLNDGMAWGLFPVLYAASGLDLATIGTLAATYPATQGVLQLATGAWSDRVGRKPLIVAGMLLQALALGYTAGSASTAHFAAAAVLLGAGTALVYPTLIAAISDAAAPHWRASAVGIYRFWRDAGYPIGALLSAAIADFVGIEEAILTVAALTALSGIVVALRMRESRATPTATTTSPPDTL